MRLKKLIFSLICFSFLITSYSLSLNAQDTQVISSVQAEPLKIKLLSENLSINPGKAFQVGILLNIRDGYHVYWKHPGEFGLPLNISWQLPKNLSVTHMAWENPHVYKDNVTVFGYEKEALIIATIESSQDLSVDQDVPIKVSLDWLACSEDCVSGSSSEEINLSVVRDATDRNPDFGKLWAQYRSKFPQEINKDLLKISLNNRQELIFDFLEKQNFDFEKILFIPDLSEYKVGDFFAAQETRKTTESVSLTVFSKNTSLINVDVVKGTLLFQNSSGEVVSGVTVNNAVLKIPGEITIAASSSSVSSMNSTFFLMLGLAFIGGLALNIMPCVLPLITLKIYGLIKTANEDKSTVVKHGCFFAFGVISCFLILAGIAFSMKLFGHNVGWGFQLQEPIFVAILVIVFFLFSLSSLGVFQLGSVFLSLGNKKISSETKPKHSATLLLSSFANGLLATLVTTPCTGPFLGSVLGLVMSLPFIRQVLIFSVMGLGMSSPYLLFSIFPTLIRFLPKPGNWMVIFKQITGFVMMLTVLWLSWVFASETSTEGLFYLLFALLISGAAAWILGQWGSPVVIKRKRRIMSLVAFSLILVSVGSGIYGSKIIDNSSNMTLQSSWEIFSAEKLATLRKEGKSVFVDFTAKWCLTCQANKSVLHNKESEEFFISHNIVRLVADWTKKDPEISSELAKLGRASVPAYVFYPQGDQDPIVLPQTLTFKVIAKEIGAFFFDHNERN